MFCSNCGKQIDAGSKFCKFCGANVSGGGDAPSQETNDANSLYSLGDESYNQDDYAQAIAYYEKAVSIAPPNNAADFYFNLGLSYIVVGNNARGIECYEKLIGIDPNNSNAYRNLGIAYGNVGNTDKQMENYRIAASLGDEESKQWVIDDEPEPVNPRIDYADGSYYVGESNNGIRQGKGKYTFANGETCEGYWVENAMQGKGAYSFPNGNVYEGDFVNGRWHGKGKFTHVDGRVEEGEYIDGIFTGGATNEANSLYSLGDEHYNQRNWGQAIECYEKASSIAPPYNASALFFNLGYAYHETGNYARAIEWYEKTVAIDPNNAAAYNNLGYAYSNLGNRGKQLENYRIAARLGYESTQQWLIDNGYSDTETKIVNVRGYTEKDDIIKTMLAEGVDPESADDQVFGVYNRRYMKGLKCFRCGGKLSLLFKCKSCGASVLQGTM